VLRLLGLNRINFLVKKSFIFLALLGSVFLIFNSPSNVYAEDSSASLTVTGNFNIDLTPQGTEQIMLRASGMQAIAKTSSIAGYSLYVSGGDENGNFTNEKAPNSILKPLKQNSYYGFPSDGINIWGFCSQPYGATNRCDSSYYAIGKPSAPTLLKKSDTATPSDGFTYKANLFARANQQIVSGKYVGDITFSLIVNDEITSTLVTGRDFNKAIREATGVTDPTILNNPTTELPSQISTFKFAKAEPSGTDKKTVKVSIENSEEPVYLTAVKNYSNRYDLTVWSNAHHIVANQDSSYMFSGLANLYYDIFSAWPSNNLLDFSKVKNFSHFYYKIDSFSKSESSYYKINVPAYLYNAIAKSNPTNIDSMFEDANVDPHLILNTTGPISTNKTFKNNGKRSYSAYISGNFIENSSDMTSLFEGSQISLSSAYAASENFGKYTTSTNSMFKNSSTTMIDFGKANFVNLTDTESMFENYSRNYVRFYMPKKANNSKLKKMRAMFKNIQTDSDTTIDLSSFNTEAVTDMSYLIGNDQTQRYKYSRVSSITLGDNFITKNVTNMEGMFRKVYDVRTLNLGANFDTSKVTNMFAMFEGGYNLQNLILGDKFKTDEVTNMSRMFAGCWYVKDIDFSKFNTKNVTDMSYMFNDATAFRNFTNTAKFDTGKVTDMSYMFSNTRFTTLDLSAFNTKNVTNMAYMFDRTSNSVNITYPAVFDTSKVTDMNHMFNESYIKNLPAAGFDTRNVTNMSYMFRRVYYMKDPQVFNLNTRNVTNMENMFELAFESQPNQNAIFGSDFNTEKVITMANMFKESNIGEIDLTNFVGAPEATTMASMFDKTKATKITFPATFNTSKVTDMSRMFAQIYTLPTNLHLKLPFDTSSLTTMNQMFYSFPGESIDVSSFNTQNVTDFSMAFYGAKITSLDLSHFNLENVTTMSSAFNDCYNLVTLNLTGVKTSNKLTTMSSLFYRNYKLTSVDLSGFDTSNVNSFSNVFYQNRELTTIYVSEKFVVKPSADKSYAFDDDNKLVGGAGTVYNYYNSNANYLRIDDPSNSKPGYFTYKAAP
jgi:hypothetical protein